MGTMDEVKKLKADLMEILKNHIGEDKERREELLSELFDRMSQSDNNTVCSVITGG